jgi:glycosyltransferase involved in cell wall biosynthesis
MARELQLLWHGPFREPTGYADEGRAFLLSLERGGYTIAAREAPWLGADPGLPASHTSAIDRACARPIPEGELVLVSHLVPRPGQPLSERGPTVARTMFETDRIPPLFLARLMEVDEVWVPCDFNLDTFRRGGLPGSKLHVLPETIDFELYDPAATEPLDIPGMRGFTFLSNFDFTDRKGCDILLAAWADAFDPDDDVCLVLKCLSLNDGARPLADRVAELAGLRPTAPVVLVDRLMGAAEMPSLYAAADAYVMASRGEGWGRPYMEAMAMGLPTIGSRWSGNLMFMHDANAWLVDGSVVDVAEGAQSHAAALYRGHRWFEPDREALAATLREVAAGASKAPARPELIECFGPEPIAARIAELTEGALERARWRRSRPVACVWRGDWGSIHSLAIVNEAIADAIEADAPVERRLAADEPVANAAVGVAQQWPPSFEAPSDGPFVLYQPWEFGAVPAAWVTRANRVVDEVWTPSESARKSWIASGLSPELVQVVPNAVDLRHFTPEGPERALPTGASTVFLFVGGAIWRKGIDVLLRAYAEAFRERDDVCLVVKTFGGETVYRGQTPGSMFDTFSGPELLVLDDEVPFSELPALYRAADVLVQPYRAEGFCLPALEALACGLPVITTAGGPTDDFVGDLCGWRIPSSRRPLEPDAFGDDLRLGAEGFTLEPDHNALVAAFRAAADPGARADRARSARAHAQRYSWARAAEAAKARLTALEGREPIRRVRAQAVESGRSLRLVAVDDWAAALLAFAEAFGPDDPVTLVLPGVTADEALALVDGDAIGDVALVNGDLTALVLGADAVIGAHPRARVSVAADPEALKRLIARPMTGGTSTTMTAEGAC